MKFSLDTRQVSHHNYYVQLSEIKIGLLANGSDIADLPQTSITQIQNVADNDNGTAGTQAKGLLNAVYGYNYQIVPKTAGTGSQNFIAPPNQVQQQHFHELEAWPNPAKKHVNFRYNLPEDISEAIIQINDIKGNLIKEMPITGQKGSANWSIGHLPEGIYLYTVKYKNGQSTTRKLVLIK